MAFDPSVISSIPDYTGDPVGAEEKAITMRDALDREQLNKLQLKQQQTQAAEDSQVKKILSDSDYSTPEGLAATAAKVNKVSPKGAMDLLKFGQQYQSGQVQQQMDQLTLADQRQGLIVQAIDPIVAQARQMKNQGSSDLDIQAFISQQMPGAINQLRGMKLGDGKPALPDDQLQMVTNIQGGYTLPTLEGWESRSKQGQAAIKQRLDQLKADTQSKAESVRESQEDERVRHDEATEATARQNTQIRQDAAGPKLSSEDGQKVNAVYAAMADNGISFPSGMRSAKAQRDTITGLLASHPNDSAEQIANRVKAGEIGTGAQKTESTVVARREGSSAAAITALNEDGGLYDQLDQTGQKIDFGSNKFATNLKLWKAGKVVADPDVRDYLNALADTRAEFASVLARGGQVTDSVRIASEHAFPDNMSYAELQTAINRSKKVADAIQSGNDNVMKALINGKSLSEALKASPSSAGAAPGGTQASSPSPAARGSPAGASSQLPAGFVLDQ